MDSPPARGESIEDLVKDLDRAARITANQRAIKISKVVERISTRAYEEGLASPVLETLLDIVTSPSHLGQASINTLVKNLYPASKVSDAIAIKVVGALGHGQAKPGYNVQAALLKWLIMVYDVLENPNVLSQLYSPLFNLLDTIALRAQLCHVLSLITRRKHVRPFRIQVLLELVRHAGREPPLIGLMRVFKDYYPEVIVGDAVAGRASVFTHPNPEWRQRLAEIQETYLQRTQDLLPAEKRAFRVARKGANGTRRMRSSIIPEVRTSYALESSVTLEEIEDVQEFVQKLEVIEPPNQLVAVLGDSLLQKYLQLRFSDSSSKRINNWLFAFFEDQQENLDPSEAKILAMLDVLLEYTRYTKEIPQACLVYLNSILPEWNGTSGRHIILELLTYIPIAPFDDLYTTTLQPLQEAILYDGTDTSKLYLLTFFTKLLSRWSIQLLTHPSPPPTTTTTITSLINHANNLCLTLLQTTLSLPTQTQILAFYTLTSTLTTVKSLTSYIRIIIPPASIIYTLNFTLSLPIVSHLCSILVSYKKAFEHAMTSKDLSTPSYPKEYVNNFNGYLMDICNCLWRSRAFNTSDPNALGCLIPPTVSTALGKYITGLDTGLSVPSIFTFSQNPTISLLAIKYVRDLEDKSVEEIEIRHAGPVTQNSLRQLEKDGGIILGWQEYKVGVLKYLEGREVLGLGELMYNTMKNLMGSNK